VLKEVPEEKLDDQALQEEWEDSCEFSLGVREEVWCLETRALEMLMKRYHVCYFD
jgi:hypothetical protein